MSLVGTRPPTLDEWEQYEPHHRARMAFRPGVTGMWQVSGRSNITDFEEVVKLDTKYINEWNLRLDTYDIMGAVAPYAARNNIIHLSVASSRQRSIMIGEDVRKDYS